MERKPRRADNVSIKEAAERLNAHQDTVKAGLISGLLPFGSAVRCVRNYSYIIPRDRFETWISGKDLAEKSILQNQVMRAILQALEDVSRKIDLVSRGNDNGQNGI